MERFLWMLLLACVFLSVNCGGDEGGASFLVDTGAAEDLSDSGTVDQREQPPDEVGEDQFAPPADIPPGTEVCNGLDDNNDGEIDEAGAVGCKYYFKDLDKDGFGVSTASICLCAPEKPYTALQKGDCDDLDAAISPKAQDICGNALDEDCDGVANVVDCTGKECGDDGCGGSCGTCGEKESCVEGQCIPEGCIPDCLGKECGSNGCGGVCGECQADELCSSQGQCVPGGCVPQCDGYECGGDTCGGVCGTCGQSEQCVGHFCEPKPCEPVCEGKQCGNDGCGGKCGTCQGQGQCVNGQCQCVPDCTGKQCGADGCGGSCGTCNAPSQCINSQCKCQPNCFNKQCGDDGCGGSCGSCTGNQQCKDFTCQEGPCEPKCVGKQCGSDGCGGACGTCPAATTCTAGQCIPDAPALPKMVFDPAAPNKGNAVHVTVTDDSPWAYVGLGGMGPCGNVETQWGGVDSNDNGTWTWHYNTSPLKAGVHTFTFTANNGQEHVITQQLTVSGAAGCQ